MNHFGYWPLRAYCDVVVFIFVSCKIQCSFIVTCLEDLIGAHLLRPSKEVDVVVFSDAILTFKMALPVSCGGHGERKEGIKHLVLLFTSLP